MSKIYQPKSVKWIPHNRYMQIIYIIRDYDRLKVSINDVIEESPPPPDGMPRGNGTGNPTANKAAKLERVHEELRGIERAINTIPEEYRQSVLNNIQHNIRFPDYADYKTWKTWKRLLVQRVGENLNML